MSNDVGPESAGPPEVPPTVIASDNFLAREEGSAVSKKHGFFSRLVNTPRKVQERLFEASVASFLAAQGAFINLARYAGVDADLIRKGALIKPAMHNGSMPVVHPESLIIVGGAVLGVGLMAAKGIHSWRTGATYPS